MINRCLLCHRKREDCTCPNVCHRCMLPSNQCTCEQSLRPSRDYQQDSRYEMDEDVQDDLRRDYGDSLDDERPLEYWKGYYAASAQRHGDVPCPYQHPVDRSSFYRGVSDARYNRYLQ
jgi:ribosome modulation factor